MRSRNARSSRFSRSVSVSLAANSVRNRATSAETDVSRSAAFIRALRYVSSSTVTVIFFTFSLFTLPRQKAKVNASTDVFLYPTQCAHPAVPRLPTHDMCRFRSRASGPPPFSLISSVPLFSKAARKFPATAWELLPGCRRSACDSYVSPEHPQTYRPPRPPIGGDACIDDQRVTAAHVLHEAEPPRASVFAVLSVSVGRPLTRQKKARRRR